jgi:two-component system phosphate regulon sensor histidine kinase PhoR
VKIINKKNEVSTHFKRIPWKYNNYYFVVVFPDKTATMIAQMGIWLFSSAVLLIICLFFTIAVFIILKQKRLSEVQKDFVNTMTHEFKNPLSTITVSADLLKQPEVNKNQEQVFNYTELIKEEVKRIRNHIDRVLQIASYDKGSPQLQKVYLNLHECIQAAVGQVKQLPENGNISLEMTFHATQFFAFADPFHITNVILNLLDNAIKFGGVGVNIIVSTTNKKKYWVVAISDNGPGISREHHKKIFDKFYRVKQENSRNKKGFGLGLFYVKQIIKAHKGHVNIESEPGGGTVFTVYLPIS